MRNYWTCSKFADWLRGTPKLYAGTGEEWDQWTSNAKRTNPLRYWMAETALGKLDDAFHWLPERINDVRYYLNNRFSSRTHTLTSSSLERGKWHEFETRLLHCSFDELVNFVEIEKAWIHVCWNDEARAKFNTPWWRKNWWGRWLVQWRCPESGIEYLKWEMSLKNTEWVDPADPEYGLPTPQAVAAKEQWALYYWWKHVRPLRVDPHDYSGWTAHCEQERDEGKSILSSCNTRTPEEEQKIRKMLDMCSRLEENYAKEDEEMLIRLVKIRQHLWT